MSKKKIVKSSTAKKEDTKLSPNFQISANAKTHTDVVEQIREIQKKYADDNPNENKGIPYDFSKSHLHIGLPCYGGMLLESTMTSLIKFILLAGRAGLNWSIDTMVNESLITRGRNNLMAKMLTNKAATHFMFIDADIRFEAESVLQMMAANKDIIAGMYPKKSYPIAYNINLKAQTKLQGPLFTVDTAATGFLMFKREVYEKLIEAHPNTKYVDDVGLGKQYEPNMFAIFDCVIDEKGHYLSEDWTFCRRASALGFDIWCDGRVLLNHSGTHEFVGDLSKICGPILPANTAAK
jgi:hypothetical protein